MIWQFAEAEASLDEIFTKTIEEGPQFIVRGNEEFVFLSRDAYQQLIKERPDFIQHILDFPRGDYLNLERDRSPMREIDLGE